MNKFLSHIYLILNFDTGTLAIFTGARAMPNKNFA